MKEPFVIGISGSIGSGKSLIRHLLALRGVLPVDADELTHFLLLKDKAGYREVVRIFGEDYLDDKGDLDRSKLGGIVFRHPRELQKLEAILHPLVQQIVLKLMEASPTPLIAVEAIKLYTSQLLQLCDSRWFVTAALDSQLERLKKMRGMNADAALERLHQQYFPDDVQINYFIENSGSFMDTWEQVRGIWHTMQLENPDFNGALKILATKMLPVMLDYPQLEQIDHDLAQKLVGRFTPDFVENDLNWEEVLFSQRYFINQITASPNEVLLWRYDHFNAIVSPNPSISDSDAFIFALEKLEDLVHLWLGNGLIINIKNASDHLSEKLQAAGYQKFDAVLVDEYPFFKLAVLEGAIESHRAKPFRDGIWRFIP